MPEVSTDQAQLDAILRLAYSEHSEDVQQAIALARALDDRKLWKALAKPFAVREQLNPWNSSIEYVGDTGKDLPLRDELGFWALLGSGAFASAQELSFRECRRFLTNLGPLAALCGTTKLALDQCPVDIDALGELEALRDLRIELAPGGSIAALANLRQLKRLSIHGHIRRDEVAVLASFVELEHLELEVCRLEDFSFLARLRSLESLKLSSLEASPKLESLRELGALRRLEIGNPESFDCTLLAGLDQLESLDLCAGALDIRELTNLKRLTELDLHAQTDFDLSPLPTLPALRRLQICVRTSDLSAVGRCAGLEALDVSSSTGPDLSTLQALPNLRTFDMWHVDESVDLSPLGNLGSLEEITITACHGAFGFEAFGALVKLKKLYINFNGGPYRKSRFDPSFISNLRSLEELNISENGCDEWLASFDASRSHEPGAKRSHTRGRPPRVIVSRRHDSGLGSRNVSSTGSAREKSERARPAGDRTSPRSSSSERRPRVVRPYGR